MIRSMTGYGRVESEFGGKKFAVEIKSLNHRYLEVSVRLPNALSAFDLEIRKKLGEHFSRGRLDVFVRVDAGEASQQANVALNLPLARNYWELLQRLKEEFGLKEDVGLGVFAGMRDIFVSVEPAEDQEGLKIFLDQLFERAISALMEMKRKEGEALCRDLLDRVALVERHLETISARCPQVLAEFQRRLAERIRELAAGVVVDEARLSQEIAIMAEKSDITEEITRLKSHIVQFREMIGGDEPVGRKVDFLLQEMNREVNTIGSKSTDVEISRSVIEMKSELAKLREQVQNLE